MSITVRTATTPSDQRAFLSFPGALHGTDPCFVPPVAFIQRRRTRRFVAEGVLKLFVAERDGRIVGTISALRDRSFERDRNERVVWFGYLCAEDDPAVAEALFGAVRTAARAWGAQHIRGPRDLTRFENMGLTIAGHETLPPFLQNHHPPYYQPLVEAAGLVPHHDVFAYEIPVVDADGRPQDLPPRVARKAEAVDIAGLQIRAARRSRMGRDLALAHRVLNAAYRTVPDVAPMSRAAFVSVGRPYLTVADPRLLQIALVEGEPVGFAACLPELNEALVAAQGALLPLGWARVAAALRRVRTASFKLIGVVPEHRGTGLHAALIARVVEGVKAAGYHRVEASVIDERNGPMRAVVEGIGMRVYRRYRLYEGAVS